MIKKITDLNIKDLSEGTRLSFTYSIIDGNTGKIIDSNAKGSFIILDDMIVNYNGQDKNIMESAKILTKAALNKIE